MSMRPLRPWLPAAMLPLGGCDNRQTALLAHGPEADQIAILAWLLFAVCAFILALVIAALWLAMRGSPRVRAHLAGERIVIGAGIVLPVVTLTGLLGYSTWMQAVARAPTGDSERIEVVGEQWWWRILYTDRDGRQFASANEIRIPAGRSIDFTLRSADVIHSFWIPSLAGKLDMIPGRTTRQPLAAHAPGVFRGQCAEYCGGPHALMAVQVVAMPETEFTAWREREAAPAREPATEPERRGQRLFLSAGCGGCHAIRGTDATGSIGPDLTHLGARHSLAAGTLTMSAENLTTFIADGQRAKPGNLMPPFRIFSRQELEDIATYLLSLR
jgi:cytochrome c oxidase subunit II